MSEISTALKDIRDMDELSLGDSCIHKLGALPKFLMTIVYIAFVVSIDKYEFSRLVPFMLYPIMMFELSNTSLGGALKRLRFVLPLVMAVGVINPFLNRDTMLYIGSLPISYGFVSMLTLMLKGIYTIMASYVLVATTRFDDICGALRRLHVPSILVTLLLLTYRYIHVMMDELSIMNQAYKLRAPGQKGIHYSAWGSFLGQMFLRSMDRATELFEAMQLRGFDESYRYVRTKKIDWKDMVYIISSISSILLFKLVDIAELLGSLVM